MKRLISDNMHRFSCCSIIIALKFYYAEQQTKQMQKTNINEMEIKWNESYISVIKIILNRCTLNSVKLAVLVIDSSYKLI